MTIEAVLLVSLLLGRFVSSVEDLTPGEIEACLNAWANPPAWARSA